MIWLCWQQHRIMALFGGLVVVLLVPFLIVTGLAVSQAAQAAVACPPATAETCLAEFHQFVSASPVLVTLSSLPLLVGVFIGAPLVARELEQGTYLLAWTQGVPRRRWLLWKLGVLFGLTSLGFAAVAGMMVWWSAPVDATVGPWPTFEVGGLVPFAYAVFALALGIAAGTLLRQTVAAMGAAAAIFVGLRLAVAQLRPDFLPPVRAQVEDLCSGAGRLGGCQALGAQSFAVNKGLILQKMPVGKPEAEGATGTVHALVLYQPSDRFWTFQGIEAAIFVALALALIALTLWWMRHRIA
jgi:hypothetical protein